MEVRIWPRNPEEKGGYAMMPMKKNIPVAQEGWELTTCPACGCECWKMPRLKTVIRQGATALCTECVLKIGTAVIDER